MAKEQTSKKKIKEDIPQVTNSTQPLELQTISKHLESIAESLTYIKVMVACNHAPKIKDGIKFCPFCDVTIGKTK